MNYSLLKIPDIAQVDWGWRSNDFIERDVFLEQGRDVTKIMATSSIDANVAILDEKQHGK